MPALLPLLLLCLYAEQEKDETIVYDGWSPSPWFVLGTVVFWVLFYLALWEIVKLT